MAVCCWCGTGLKYDGTHWWCPTKACYTQQRLHGIADLVGTHIKRWLYVPTPKQVEFDRCAAKYVLYGGAAGPGKSHGARWGLYRRCLRIPQFEALLLRRTFPELESTHLLRMAQEAESVGATFTKSDRLIQWPNGSFIRCGHMEEAADVQKYLSTDYDAIVADEGSTFDPTALFELVTRARSSKPQVIAAGGARFWVVSNPGGPSSSRLLDFFIDHSPDFDDFAPALARAYRPEDWVYIPAYLEDNPYMDPGYESQLALTSKWRYEQLRHGDWRVFMGQFFSQFNERRHVKDLGDLGDDVMWFRSLDWGFNAPGCWGFYAILPDGRIYKRSDRKFSGESVHENVKALRQHTAALGIANVVYDVGDPSIYITTGNVAAHTRMTGQSIGETFSLHGIQIRRGENDRYNGWQRLHDLLRDAPDGDPWMIFHPACKYTIRSLASAVSKDTDPDDVGTSDDHALDETRYAGSSRPHPHARRPARPHYAPGTMGALRSTPTRRARLGEESVRPYA